jgi:hypothetical protein
MAKEEHNHHTNPWYIKDNYKKCSCKQCTPDGCKGCKCEPLTKHPSFQTPVVTVEEAIEAYRKAKLAHITAQNNARKAKEALAVLEKETIDTYSAEILAKDALERALSEEAKNNG